MRVARLSQHGARASAHCDPASGSRCVPCTITHAKSIYAKPKPLAPTAEHRSVRPERATTPLPVSATAARINRCAVPLCRLFMKIESVYLLIKSFCRTDPGRLAAQRLLGAKYWLIIANSNLEINIVRAPHARWRTWIPQYLIVS